MMNRQLDIGQFPVEPGFAAGCQPYLVLQDHKRLPGRFFARLSGASGDRLSQ